VPSDAILAAWAGVTGVALDTLADLAQRAKSGTPDWFMNYRQAEAQASILRCWSPVLVPGVLQCESYMRAALSVEDYSAEQLDALVATRLERQAVTGLVLRFSPAAWRRFTSQLKYLLAPGLTRTRRPTHLGALSRLRMPVLLLVPAWLSHVLTAGERMSPRCRQRHDVPSMKPGVPRSNLQAGSDP
jgi:hypothetical protein